MPAGLPGTKCPVAPTYCFHHRKLTSRSCFSDREVLLYAAFWMALMVLVLGLGHLLSGYFYFGKARSIIALVTTGGLSFALVVHIAFVEHARRRGLLNIAYSTRRTRLAKLVRNGHAARRFPNRLIEAAISQDERRCSRSDMDPRFEPRRSMARGLPKLAAGSIIVGPHRPLHGRLLPGSIPWPFEPIDARDRRDMRRIERWERGLRGRRFPSGFPIGSAVQWQTCPGGAHIRTRLRTSKNRRSTGLAGLVRSCLQIGLTCAAVAICVGLLFGTSLLGWREFKGAIVLFPLSFAALGGLGWFITTLIRREQIWLVPGGVIVARHSLNRAHGKALYVRRDATPIVVDLAESSAQVLVGKRLRRIPFGWAHLIAWVASAPSPSVEAVQALVGDDVELTVAG
jgi:hypothetical protein